MMKRNRSSNVRITPNVNKKPAGKGTGKAAKKHGFDSRQLPWAIAAVVAVIIVIVLVLVLAPGKSDKKNTTTKAGSSVTTTKKGSKTPTTTDDVDTTAVTQAQDYSMQGSVLVIGTSAMEVYYVSESSLTNYGNVISSFAAKVPDSSVYVCLAPSSIEFNGPQSYHEGAHSQAKGISIAYSACTGANVKTVDARGEIAKHTAEYLYFRTDHHWTDRGAYYAYKAFCKASSQKASDIKKLKTAPSVQGYLGTMYGYSGGAQVLKDNPDYIEIFYPAGYDGASGQIFSDASMQNGRNFSIINTSGKSYAAIFISGDQPLEKITTANTSGRSIAVVKNSFGDAFIPYLIDNYTTIYVIDPRSVTFSLADFVKANGVNDVLFLTNLMAPSISSYMKPLTTMLS